MFVNINIIYFIFLLKSCPLLWFIVAPQIHSSKECGSAPHEFCDATPQPLRKLQRQVGLQKARPNIRMTFLK